MRQPSMAWWAGWLAILTIGAVHIAGAAETTFDVKEPTIEFDQASEGSAPTGTLTHEARVASLNTFDAGRPLELVGEVTRCGTFFSPVMGQCTKSGITALGATLFCVSTFTGRCADEYKAKTIIGVTWPLFDPGAPSSGKTSGCQSPRCIGTWATGPGSGPTGDGTGPQPTGTGNTPIVLDLDGDGFHFTGLDDAVSFDINADGTPDTVSWTTSGTDDALLALDRSGNGTIDGGGELFGSHTEQPASPEPNGFLALAVFDQPGRGGNGDGSLSQIDAIFGSLRLWTDANHDGISQPAELEPLIARGVRAIDLDYIESRRRDRHGNQLRWASHVQFERSRRLAAADVIFLVDEP